MLCVYGRAFQLERKVTKELYLAALKRINTAHIGSLSLGNSGGNYDAGDYLEDLRTVANYQHELLERLTPSVDKLLDAHPKLNRPSPYDLNSRPNPKK